MTAKTAAERMQATRDKRAREGLAELRGVWVPTEMHAAIKHLIALHMMDMQPAQRMRKEGKK